MPAAITASGAVATFFLGEKILKNIEAWGQIGKNLKAFFQTRRATFIDANAAITLVISDLGDVPPSGVLEVHCQVVFGTPVSHGAGELGKHPYAVYTVTVLLRESVLIHGVDSTGKTLFNEKHSLNWHDFND